MAKPKKITSKKAAEPPEVCLPSSTTKPKKHSVKQPEGLVTVTLSSLPVEQKKTKRTKASEIKEAQIEAEEKIRAEQLVAQAMLRYKNDVLAEKKIKIKEISHLSSIAEEYLSCFALIGYSLLDEKVIIFNMPTAKDEAALIDLLRSTFLDIAGNRP